MRVLKGAVILGVLLAAASAHAGVHFWSSNGAGCVPGDPAIEFGRYFITAGAVNYRPGGNGLVTLYCPITSTAVPACPNSAYRFLLTYTDSDGSGDLVSVGLRLIRLSKVNGAFQSIVPAATGATLNSNLSHLTTPASLSVSFDHAFNFDNYYYYARVDMNRDAATIHIATFYGVGIECR